MQIEDLPLLELFNRLRQAGLSLGLGEYQLVLRALQAGFGVSDRVALAHLCCTIWVKSAEEKRIFNYHFQQLMNQTSPGLGSEKGQSSKGQKSRMGRSIPLLISVGILVAGLSLIDTHESSQRLNSLPDNLSLLIETSTDQLYRPHITPTQIPQQSTTPLPEATIFEESAPVSEPNDRTQQNWIVLAVILILAIIVIVWLTRRRRRPRPNLSAPAAKPQVLTVLPAALTQQIEDEVQVAQIREVITTGDYFPVTRRQMKQSWRYLRRMVREGPPTELDLDATVQAIGRQGMLLQPIFVPRRINRARVILLLDQEGSMAPFHGLSQRLIETAYQGRRLTPAGIYYFHNCPMEHLYHDPDHQQAESLDQVLNHLQSEYTGVLIFSDAGAAHGRWNPERLRSTQTFLIQLKQTVRYIVWLNPMPRERWPGSTAEPISRWVPMFELDRRGLDAALQVLRGQSSRYGEAVV